ncbi:MAG: NADH-ubiquinone oxidoreductase-F iron-sulfur binding region domain-containing protein [Bacilli bacterium]|nr:NADH-ubiquinone oxidoreductase-F iron-sulfur binding region domain-containing protein [Bacilli bacterium]
MCLRKLSTYEDLKKFHLEVKDLLNTRLNYIENEKEITHYHISICNGTGCLASKGDVIKKRFEEIIKAKKLEDKVSVTLAGCFGFCEKGPIVKVFPDHIFYCKVKVDDVEKIVEQHLINRQVVEELLYVNSDNARIKRQEEIPFYRKQKRIALRNCGLINPENILESIANNGYLALGKALFEMTRLEVIESIYESGLRGRGGGGFRTGLKWSFAYKEKDTKKYVICNADEGDPGAFMDRSILEGDPNSVIEAMIIAGYAIGSDEGNIYIRAEYPLAVKRLQIAISQAKSIGLLGENILGSGFNFDIKIKYGAGAFVCGEETALIQSIEGKRGEPTTRPPFPTTSGLYGHPTIVNNVETLANVSYIILNGAQEFKKIGTIASPGTKVFALAGKINNVGLVEVPMGITLREIIYDIGGGIKNGKKFKAVQTGGPSGGCLQEKDLDTPIDFDNLLNKGSMMGSGGMIVLDEDDCMVNIAKFYLEFTVEESCGKCTPCRIGKHRMLEILTRICSGKGTLEDLEKLENLANVIKDTALCGLGQSSPNPILSTIHNFKDEYIEHVVDKKCRAKACKDLLSYNIVQDKCMGCSMCSKKCPADAIYKTTTLTKNGKMYTYQIDQDKCIKCGTCILNCKFNAITKG